MKYVYPAVFHVDEDGKYLVVVPDLPGCSTFGEDIADTMAMARDAIALWLCDAEDKKETIPVPTQLKSITTKDGEFISLIDVDTLEYRKENDNRAVKKTLTIPNWLNNLAESQNINFSSVLQAALKDKLGV